MPTVAVMPLPDSVSMRSNWQVKRGSRRVSTHTKKSAARRKAKRVAKQGDTIKIYRMDGTIQTNLSGG